MYYDGSTWCYSVVQEDVPNDDALGTNQKARHDYDGPNGAFQTIEDLTQLMQGHVRATSTWEKSLYGEFRIHKLPSFDGSTNMWAAEYLINQIGRVFVVLRCLPNEQIDLVAYMLTSEV